MTLYQSVTNHSERVQRVGLNESWAERVEEIKTLRASSTTDIPYAYVLRSEHVDRITHLLCEHVGPVVVTISCADGVDRTFSDPLEVNRFENDRIRRITGLTIRASANDRPESAYMRFADRTLGPITIFIDGSDTTVERLRPEVLALLDGTRPWYARFARLDFVWVGLSCFLILILAAKLAVGFGWIRLAVQNLQSDPSKQALSDAMTWIIPGAIVAVGLGLNKLRETLFPMAVFAIGQGEDRHALLEKVRWTVVVGLIIGVIASVVAGRVGG